MCGIIGYSGNRPVIPVVLEGLHRLEYRGYDSAGVAFSADDKLQIVKATGKISCLEEKLQGISAINSTTGIGHTRWATHGLPNEINAHPHLSQDGDIALVHNGIIENYQEIKNRLLKQGHTFISDTDTEVLAHLIGEEKKANSDFRKALVSALNQVSGAYAVVILSKEEPGVLYAACLGAPLTIGVGNDEMFLASDVPAFLPYTKKAVFICSGEIVRITKKGYEVYSQKDLSPIQKEIIVVPWDMQAAAKDGYKHFMIKEIMEQPKVLENCLRGRIIGGEGYHKVNFPELDNEPVPSRLRIVACGTSYHAGLWAQQLFENIAGIPTFLEIASEFRYRNPILEPSDTVIVISQSGETADTLVALQMAKSRGCRVIGICNVVGSTISRESDIVLYSHAGPEISVASTKAMCSQMAVQSLLAIYFAQKKGNVNCEDMLTSLLALPKLLSDELPKLKEKAELLAPIYSAYQNVYFLGRGQCYALALEGALKLKETSYIHAEGYPSGELKHGPIALIEPSFLTIVLAVDNDLFPKVKSNVREILSRRGKVIALVQKHGDEIPEMPADEIWVLPSTHEISSYFLMLSVLQVFSYSVANYLGREVDQPRNLAKSVTVE